MKQEFIPYVPVAKAIASLLHPFAEVVIHDLAEQKIVAIFNNFSKRKVGDDSLMETEIASQNIPDFYEPYYKTNWDGKKLKSTTITIRDKKGTPVGLLCINVEIQAFEDVRTLLGQFTGQEMTAELPKELFSEDWREKISVYIHTHLKSSGKTIKGLTKAETRALIHKLHVEGAFRIKHAASFVGDILDLSRATVYKYLAELNGKQR